MISTKKKSASRKKQPSKKGAAIVGTFGMTTGNSGRITLPATLLAPIAPPADKKYTLDSHLDPLFA